VGHVTTMSPHQESRCALAGLGNLCKLTRRCCSSKATRMTPREHTDATNSPVASLTGVIAELVLAALAAHTPEAAREAELGESGGGGTGDGESAPSSTSSSWSRCQAAAVALAPTGPRFLLCIMEQNLKDTRGGLGWELGCVDTEECREITGT
jgi:hypothetical protein